MGLSIWHILVVVLVVLLLFGTRRLPGTMEDMAKGIKAFKRGLKDDSDNDPARIETARTDADKTRSRD